jgi:hypothetical protein
MAISRMQQPRQMYGLGSLVKKAVRGVKKIVKSPIGKAALIGGLGMYGMGAGPFSGMKGAGFLKGLMGARSIPGVPDWVTGKGTGGGFFTKGLGRFLNPWSSGEFSGKHAFGLASAAALAAPFLMKGDDEEEEVEESWTQIPSSIASIRNQARNYYTDPASSTLSFMPGKQFVQPNFYAADGGRVGLLNGGEAGQEQIEQMLMAEFVKYKNQGGTLTFEQFVEAIMQAQQEGQGMEQPQEVMMAANGGRIGYAGGQLVRPSADGSRPGYRGLLNLTMDDRRPPRNKFDFLHTTGPLTENQKEILQNMSEEDWEEANKGGWVDYIIDILKVPYVIRGGETDEPLFADGGSVPGSTVSGYTTPAGHNRFDYYSGGDPVRVGAYNGGLMIEDEDETTFNPYKAMAMYKRPGKQEGGIMETEEASEMIDLGGKEKDYRETGGFVEIGGKERADDVPARLSKNEFVFTADAVRAAGGGDIDKGSEVMQNLMDNLEAGGEVSEESQGLEGAQAMYDQQQMLQSRMI